ncbi:MAG: hypothetical protein IJ583_03655 [Firmicutes bacterium]|nr:hypothetical protein [Bacillota bacterium]
MIIDFNLSDIANKYTIKKQAFEYAGIDGIAELLGWQIVFFYSKYDLNNVSAISFMEITDNDLIDIGNNILDNIGINVRFRDNKSVITNIFGIPDFFDKIYLNTDRYNYILSENYFLSFGLENDNLTYLEIIYDKNIVNNIVETRQCIQ